MEETKPRIISVQAVKKPNPLSVLLAPVFSLISSILLFIAKIVIRFVEIIIEILWKINNRFVKFSEGFRMRVGKKFSKKSRNSVGMLVVYAGLTRNPEEILGIVLIYSLALAGLSGVFAYLLLGGQPFMGISFQLVMIGAIVGPVLLTWVLFYTIFAVFVDRRTAAIEKVLPDVLTIISQNMIAGMTVYNSLWTAARPEFGPLAMELQSVAKETLGGDPFEKALMSMAGRIKSYKLTRSVKLMIQGMRSGGELPTVLQEIANDIRVEQSLYKKMSSQTTSQVMFILFALLIGAPLLFSASLQFVSIFNNIYDKIGLDDNDSSMSMQGGMIKLSKLPITQDFFYMYAIITMGVMGIFGALLIGLIKSGKMSSGVLFIPILPTASILIFLGMTTALSSLFTGMMG